MDNEKYRRAVHETKFFASGIEDEKLKLIINKIDNAYLTGYTDRLDLKGEINDKGV